MTAKFSKAIPKVLKSEGGWVHDPDDPGGETYYGISRRFWPKWIGWKYVDKKLWKVAHAHVKPFYIGKFWLPLRCNYLSQPVAEFLFDSAVNLGKKPAVKLLQRAVNLGTNYKAELKVDGIIGPKTIKALNNTKERTVVNWAINIRIHDYFNKCVKKPVKYKYLKGWILRTLKYLVK